MSSLLRNILLNALCSIRKKIVNRKKKHKFKGIFRSKPFEIIFFFSSQLFQGLQTKPKVQAIQVQSQPKSLSL